MSPERTAKNENLAADVVVIGGGGAGLVAAVAAAEKGAKKIIVLEARRVPGGNAVNAISLFAVARQKGVDIDAQRDDFFRKTMSYAHWRINARLVRALIDKSGDIVPWLEEKGLKPERADFFGPAHASMVLRCGVIPEGIGYEVAKALVRKCEELSVRLLYQTKAKKLLTDKGRVVGVLAEVKDKEIRIAARSVIITTGGFASNKKLLKKFLPPYNDGDDVYIGGLHHKGDGLLMATEAGAATEVMAAPELSVNRFPWSSCLFIIIKHPCTLWVNKNGERFTDETVHEAVISQYRQPGKTAYTLLDEKIKQAIFKDEISPIDKTILAANMTLDVIDEKIRQSIRKAGLFVGDNPWQTIAEKDLHFQAGKGRVKIADSWDEVAKWMGADPRVLKATVDKYNAACARGHDDTFAKSQGYLMPLRTPPYYAIRCYLNLLVTHGGIKINHNMEVLDNRDNSIPGLYAAGVEAASADFDTYNPALPAHGFGFAVNSGRIAGESAAKFVKGK